jgi:hypothetical protein
LNWLTVFVLFCFVGIRLSEEEAEDGG